MQTRLTICAAAFALGAATLGAPLATPLAAQRAVALELGVFGQFSKYDDFTGLRNGLGAGARLGGYFLRNVALELEGDFTKTRSSRLGNLTALNDRADIVFYFPLGGPVHFLAGGGWTGTQYHTDTTKNQYDSGGNAVAGFKYCVNEDWAWRTDVNVDFKDPSDQTTSGQRTRTYNFRLGFSRFLGGPARNSPCYEPPPPAAAVVTPAPAPEPEPTPAPPPPQPQPEPQPAPAPPPPPAPAPPPAPVRRDLLTLRGAVFQFDKSALTAGAKDSLQRAVALLKEFPDANVEIQGHTDNVGTDKYNMALSERRAAVVKAYLVSQGIAASRISTEGCGESQPVATNSTAAGRALNRRVVIIEIR